MNQSQQSGIFFFFTLSKSNLFKAIALFFCCVFKLLSLFYSNSERIISYPIQIESTNSPNSGYQRYFCIKVPQFYFLFFFKFPNSKDLFLTSEVIFKRFYLYIKFSLSFLFIFKLFPQIQSDLFFILGCFFSKLLLFDNVLFKPRTELRFAEEDLFLFCLSFFIFNSYF